MQMLTTPVGSASNWGLCYNYIIMARDHFSKAMRSPRFHTDAYKESKEAEIEEKVENFLKRIKEKIKSIFIKRS
jgi:hypothetical protein